jgi:hypothetical protein
MMRWCDSVMVRCKMVTKCDSETVMSRWDDIVRWYLSGGGRLYGDFDCYDDFNSSG